MKRVYSYEYMGNDIRWISDNPTDTTVILELPDNDIFVKIADWCVASDSGGKFCINLSSIIPSNGNKQRRKYHFSNVEDALLFRLKWAEYVV